MACRSCGIARSGDRMAATTRHPSRCRRTVDANPSPRDAPVMTTVRGSTILARTGALTRRRWVDVRPPVRFPTRPGRPDADRVRALGARLLVKPLWIIDFGLRIRPRAGDRGGRMTDLDSPEPRAVGEVGHVDDGEHHQEGAEHRPA